MAQINTLKHFSGTIGKVVFRTLDNKQVVQSKAARMKQTKATIASGSEFRQCSTWSKQLRKGLGSFLVGLTDSYMYRRFTGIVYEALQTNTQFSKGERTLLNTNMSSLVGFEFNTHSPFTDYFTVPIAAVLNEQRQVTINMAAFVPQTDMLFPQRVVNAELVLYVYAPHPDTTATVQDHLIIALDQYTSTQPEISWTSQSLPEGHLILVCAKLLYYKTNPFTGKEYVNHKTLNPAVIVAAFGNNG